MKIELFDMDEFVDINNLKEVTSPVLFERGGIPNPNGLISNEIFGVNTKSRKETFAYIDLCGHFIHPHIYKIIKRVFRNIDKIVNGEEYFSIDKSTGKLIKDSVSGETGIDFLYQNWEKINWGGNGGMSSERTKLITKSKKNEVFMRKYIVIPAFYRDISSNKSGGGETNELNTYYTRLLRMATLIKDRDMFDFSFHSTNFNIQNTIIDIYNYLKDKLDKKSGLLRKYLLGKNVDYCVRSVISEPIYNQENPEDNIIDYEHAALPISQICTECYPFITAWLRNFFEREVIETKSGKVSTFIDIDGNEGSSIIQLKNPESYFTEKYIHTMLDKYIKDPSSRYDAIYVPTYDNKPHHLIFKGKFANAKEDESTISKRLLTVTDLLYIACCDITKDKHVMITRYPILDSFGILIAKIRVSSTRRTTPVEINGTIHKWYPVIDLSMSKEAISNNFIDTTRFSNSYLDALDGDYDGDQVTAKVIWTQEANQECDRVLKSKSTILSSNGVLRRPIILEGIQTLYVLTKDPA